MTEVKLEPKSASLKMHKRVEYFSMQEQYTQPFERPKTENQSLYSTPYGYIITTDSLTAVPSFLVTTASLMKNCSNLLFITYFPKGRVSDLFIFSYKSQGNPNLPS